MGATFCAVNDVALRVISRLMRMTPSDLDRVSLRLVPIAQDRAGFGGGLFSTGIILLLLTRHARLSRSFIQTVAIMGLTGFGAAIGVHPVIGYTNSTLWHPRISAQ